MDTNKHESNQRLVKDCCKTNQVNLSFGVTAWFISEIRVNSWLTAIFRLNIFSILLDALNKSERSTGKAECL
jgi:hypothetical protein